MKQKFTGLDFTIHTIDVQSADAEVLSVQGYK
jgi:hypothetical protein